MEEIELDELDRRLVHALQLDGRAPFSKVADVLGVSDQTIARRYRRLRTAKAMRVLGLPTAVRFGQVEWLVRVQCTPDAAESVAAALARRDDTSWVGLTAGGTEIACVVRAGPRTGGDSLLLRKLPRTPQVVGISAHQLLHMFFGGPTGWHGKTDALTAHQIEAIRLDDPPGTGERVSLSDSDARLLAALAVDGRAGLPELSAATGWSESTTKRRLEHLRQAGALYFDVEIDARLLGFTTEAILWLSVPPAELVEVATKLAGHPEVVFAAATTGSSNLAAMVVCRDTEAFYTYLTTGIGSFSSVTRIETVPVVRSVKRSGSLTDVHF